MPENTGFRTFEVELPALIEGLDLGDREFSEQTVVSTINAEEATVRLRSKVREGAKVRLSLRIPRTFFLERPLDLNLTGTVCMPPAEENGLRAKAAVRVRLDGRFRIVPASV